MPSFGFKHVFAFFLMAAFVACRKDRVEFVEYPPSTGEIDQLLSQASESESFTQFIINNNGQIIRDTLLITPDGVRIFLNDTEALFAELSGETRPCSECLRFEISVLTIDQPADAISFAAYNRSTAGDLLQAGCALLRLQVYCDGRPLQLRSDRYLKVQAPAAALLPNMRIFYGQMQNEHLSHWQDHAESDVFWADWTTNQGGMQSGYELLCRRIDWVSCQRFLSGPTQTVCLQLQDQFNADNTRAFLIFPDQQACVPLVALASTDSLCAPQIPEGLPARILAVSRTGDQYWLSLTDMVVGQPGSIPFAPAQTTWQQVIQVVRGL